ncbi:hypothetical protein GOP47_0015955 [Adiantum capillus-veneris]|uniref:Uncharacterized protein n=1 Tax=Adiantum capillus-veneris TaxID=13818 RepID=A0A9D4ZC36_ADICA|nr:hypothetical protein GOP47_0015955 [Adiantum capillus-veneris]
MGNDALDGSPLNDVSGNSTCEFFTASHTPRGHWWISMARAEMCKVLQRCPLVWLEKLRQMGLLMDRVQLLCDAVVIHVGKHSFKMMMPPGVDERKFLFVVMEFKRCNDLMASYDVWSLPHLLARLRTLKRLFTLCQLARSSSKSKKAMKAQAVGSSVGFTMEESADN